MNAPEFLDTLYGHVPDGFLEATFIAPDGVYLTPRTMVLWKPLPLENINMTRIHQLNQKGYSCYFGLAVRKNSKSPEWRVNEKTGEKRHVAFPRGWQSDAKYLTAFFVDVDSKDYGNDQQQALNAVRQLNPSIIVNSGGGYHGYLLLDQPLLITDDNRAEIKRTLKGLSKSIGADPHVAELARIFRMPDTINTKPGRNNARCEVLESNSRKYRFEDLFDEYASLIPAVVKKTRDTAPFDESEVTKALDCIPPDKISYDEWITILAGLTHSLGESEAERIGERWSGWCSEPGEISSKVASFGFETGSQTATLGSVFFIARRHGYVRTPTVQATGNSNMSSNNKQRMAAHIAGMMI